MNNFLRQALMDVHQRNQTSTYVSESFGETLGELLPFLSNKPSLANFRRHGKDEEKFYTELKNNIEEYYGNDEWLSSHEVDKGAIKISDIGYVFATHGKLPQPLLVGIKKGCDDVRKWCDEFATIEDQRDKLSVKYFREAKGKGADGAAEFLKGKLSELPSPLAKVGGQVEKLPGSFELVQKKSKFGTTYKLHQSHYLNSNGDIPAFTKAQIKEAAKTIIYIIDAIKQCHTHLARCEDGVYDPAEELGMGDEYYDQSPDALGVFKAFTIEGFDDMEVHVAREVVKNLAMMAGGLEKLMRRSLK